MKKCPYCAEEIRDEAIKCRFCGEFLTSVPDDKAKPSTQTKPGTKPQQVTQIPQTEESKVDVKRQQKIIPSSVEKGKKPEAKPVTIAAELSAAETKEATAEKPVAPFEEPVIAAKKKKDWILIIAIIVFGILLLIIQFSKQLGIEGFP